MTLIDQVGHAIHNAKKVGGPWGPACGRPVRNDYEEEDWLEVGYDDNSESDYACECKSMAQHLLEELIKL